MVEATAWTHCLTGGVTEYRESVLHTCNMSCKLINDNESNDIKVRGIDKISISSYIP